MKLYPLVMAGGSGTRFWPLSRAKRPKQFLPLATSRPLLVETLARMQGLASLKDAFIVCGKAHAAAVRRLARGVPAANVLVEPAARNTAAAIGLAAHHIARRDPAGVVVALPSDHHVADVQGFQDALREAAAVATGGSIVTLGIRPDRPETGFGYIQLGGALDGGAYRAAAFVEKPDLPRAEHYLRTGGYLWNGGIFIFQAQVMLDALAQHAPELAAGLEKIGQAIGTRGYAKVLAKVFPKLPSTSIDYAVAEKASNLAVLPGEFGWSDVGSFAAMSEVRPLDEHRNVVAGKGALVLDSEGSVILAGDRPLAVIGVKDLVVVDAGDAVLVVPKDLCQDVRKAVDALKARKQLRVL